MHMIEKVGVIGVGEHYVRASSVRCVGLGYVFFCSKDSLDICSFLFLKVRIRGSASDFMMNLFVLR